MQIRAADPNAWKTWAARCESAIEAQCSESQMVVGSALISTFNEIFASQENTSQVVTPGLGWNFLMEGLRPRCPGGATDEFFLSRQTELASTRGSASLRRINQ